MCPTDHYVRLATGLDATSAAPIRGNRRGGTNEALDVLVEVQQANSQQ
jgi:NADPH-dependent glutamate synthase beta subunit-like oxidoreductase